MRAQPALNFQIGSKLFKSATCTGHGAVLCLRALLPDCKQIEARVRCSYTLSHCGTQSVPVFLFSAALCAALTGQPLLSSVRSVSQYHVWSRVVLCTAGNVLTQRRPASATPMQPGSDTLVRARHIVRARQNSLETHGDMCRALTRWRTASQSGPRARRWRWSRAWRTLVSSCRPSSTHLARSLVRNSGRLQLLRCRVPSLHCIRLMHLCDWSAVCA